MAIPTGGGDPTLLAMKRHYLFDLLPPPQLEALVAKVKVISLEAGNRLFSHGEQADRFFLMLEGQVKLFRTTPEGNEKIIEIMQPGRSFAEAVMFMHHHSYPASCEALQSAKVLAIPSHAYLQLLRDNPEICMRLLGSLSMRLHQRVNEIETLSLQNASFRLARYLLQHLPAGAANGTRFRLPAAKQVIASQLGVTPETLSRLLRSLADSGVIEVQGANIEIRNLEALARVG